MNAAGGALAQAWQPFVLVGGLVLVGRVAAADGVFAALGGRLAAVGGTSRRLFLVSMAVVAVVTAVLNLDTSVLFLTPVVLEAARRRGATTRPFLYGVAFMSNAASLLLPGSNLTNLLIGSSHSARGLEFALATAPAWCASVVVTMFVVGLWWRRDLGAPDPPVATVAASPGLVGSTAVALATGAVVALASPALVVAGIGVAATLASARRGVLSFATLRAAHLEVLSLLFALSIAAGTVARVLTTSDRLLRHAGVIATAAIGAASAAVANNLPATMLLSATRPAHPLALLVGLDLGPNLMITGAMSSLLWWRVSRAHDERPTVREFTSCGAVVAVATIAAALGAAHVVTVRSL